MKNTIKNWILIKATQTVFSVMYLLLTALDASGKTCDVYFVETTMTLSAWTNVKHQGLCFKDEEGAIECHYMTYGLQVCDEGCHFSKDGAKGEYLRVQKIRANHRSSKEECCDWCQIWAKNKQYSLAGYDCWTLVRDFCENKKIPCSKTENSNGVIDACGVGGFVRSVTDGCSEFAKGDVVRGTLNIVSAPSRGVVEAVGSVAKNADTNWIKFKKKCKW